jgi:hypothetical protein
VCEFSGREGLTLIFAWSSHPFDPRSAILVVIDLTCQFGVRIHRTRSGEHSEDVKRAKNQVTGFRVKQPAFLLNAAVAFASTRERQELVEPAPLSNFDGCQTNQSNPKL